MLITTKFLGPTNTRGSRIKASFVSQGMTVTVGYDHSASDPHAVAAEALAVKWNKANPDIPIRGSFYRVACGNEGSFYVRVQDCQDRAFRVDPS